MKRLIILALTLTVGLSACDVLDLEPKDRVTQFDYFKTANDLELFSNPFYNNLLDKEPFDEQSDLLVQNTLSAILFGGSHRTVPESGGGWSWTDLRRMNTLLEYADMCEDKEAVTKYTAVTRFFRAFFYFEKVKRFGDVPWYDIQARFSRRVALQAPRLARTDPDQDARRHRLRHQQRRPDRIGCRPVPRQQVGGTGAQSAVLPLRGNLPQIPQPQPRRPRCELLPRSGCQGRPRNHRKGPLQGSIRPDTPKRTT